MKNVGAAKMNIFNYLCTSGVSEEVKEAAYPYRIGNFGTLITYGQQIIDDACI